MLPTCSAQGHTGKILIGNSARHSMLGYQAFKAQDANAKATYWRHRCARKQFKLQSLRPSPVAQFYADPRAASTRSVRERQEIHYVSMCHVYVVLALLLS